MIEKLDKLIQEIIENNKDLDFTSHSAVQVSSKTSAMTKSVSGAPVCKWEQEELLDKIWQCIVILEHNSQKVNQSNVMKLLGFDKSTIYKWDNDTQQRKVSELINESLSLNSSIGQDPSTSVHIGNTMGLGEMGSKPDYTSLPLTKNQKLFSCLLQPIFGDKVKQQLRIGYSDDAMSPKELMILLLTNVFVNEKWFHHATGKVNINTYMNHLNICIMEVVSRASIYSRNTSFDYLQRFDKDYKFNNLLERYGRYSKGRESFKYKVTDLLEDYIQKAVVMLQDIELEVAGYEDVNEADLIIPKDVFPKINPRDIYIIFQEMVGVNEDGNYIVKNSDTISDKHKSRVYSLMTSLKSETRLQLGFINYDISTCMQTIVSHFVDMERYPIHQQLIDDKRAFRTLLSKELDKPIDKIKEMLSSADNGKQFRETTYGMSPLFESYVEETESLVDEFMAYFEEFNPDLITYATSYAKHEYEIVGWEKKKGYSKKQPKLEVNGFKKYSMFFFVWTQIERSIRHAMMSCFDGFVHEVHDAVYSKENVELLVLEKAVLDQTGITVKIEH